MSDKINKIELKNYSDSQTLYIDGDKELISKILTYIASLNAINNDTTISAAVGKINEIIKKN